MTIRRIKLTDFRQFYGKQELSFTVDGKRNVTLIHAENGFGKTTILNAVLWALYRKVTPKFEKQDEIVNYTALKENRTKAVVEVEFEFKQQLYLVRRSHDDARDGRDKTELAVYRITKGDAVALNAPETFVSTVVPPEMAPYFFFDGEAAESFASAKNSRDVQSAIRAILGCSLAELAKADLRELCKIIEREIGNVADDKAITEIERKLEAKGGELDVAIRLREAVQTNIAAFTTQLEDIEQRLRDMKGAEELQGLREEKARRRKDLKDESENNEADVLKWIGQRSIQVASRNLAKTTLDFIDEASMRGRIPSPYNEDFVKSLLQSATCVCHRPLPPGSAEYNFVAALLKTASNAEVLNRVVRARARMQQLKEEAAQAPDALLKLQQRRAKIDQEIGRLEQEIAEISKKIEDLPIKEIADRERSRRQLIDKIGKEKENLGATKGHIVALEREKEQLGDQLDELGKRNRRTAKLTLKRQLLTRAETRLTALLGVYEKQARQDIENEINRILEIVAHKDYRCRFGEQFNLELILNDRATPKSGGENQLLSLVFIAALVKFAKARMNDQNTILRPGTMAPLVLDAPLGQLDPTYQEGIAEFVPKLAHQVILLVSGSQGGANVLNRLAPVVASEYLLVQHNEGTRGKKEVAKRTLHGKELDLTVYGAKRTMTEIQAI